MRSGSAPYGARLPPSLGMAGLAAGWPNDLGRNLLPRSGADDPRGEKLIVAPADGLITMIARLRHRRSYAAPRARSTATIPACRSS